MMRRLATVVPALALAGMIEAQVVGPTMRIPTSQEEAVTSSRLPGMDEIPPLADMRGQPNAEDMAIRAEVRQYRRQIRELKKRHFGSIHVSEIRARGLEQIREFTDPASFLPLIVELSDEQDDVRLALLDHLATQGDWGQAALGYIVIRPVNEEMHWEALKRIQQPVGQPLLNVIDQGLRSHDDFVANLSGRLAGHLNLYNTIPLLIHGQARTRTVQQPGDDAWILVGTQRVFVRALIPIIGDGAGAFLPVPGVLTDGVILRVVEAVAVIYRTEIHRTLVAMTTRDWGGSTAHLGYDQQKWKQWYEEEYLPHKREQELAERLAEEDPLRKREDENKENDRTREREQRDDKRAGEG